MDSQVLSNYNKAFTLRKDNPLEQRLDVQSPFEKHPSLGYNSHTETVTVVTARVACTEAQRDCIEHKIIEFVEGYLSTRSRLTLRHIRPVGSTTQHFLHGDYNRSRKEPDGGFRYGPNKVVIAIESGHTEAYGKLLDDKVMWINGKGVNVFILLCFRERPRFENPATVAYRDEANALNIIQDYYGPLRYRDHIWTGELHDVFIECLVQRGFRVDFGALPVTLGLRISDLYPRDIWEALGVEDSIIPFNGSDSL
ncbi:hypothetical protein V1525DRAFT_439791 [Lipomyces kononenkoae]|uniref:Uncharacterized protein n=1 Tax=Lipomyces kononenkoae TaxID=34357 RepID=A0ACC3SQX3_LIPKO